MDENLYKKISNALDDVLDLKGIIVHYDGQYIDIDKDKLEVSVKIEECDKHMIAYVIARMFSEGKIEFVGDCDKIATTINAHNSLELWELEDEERAVLQMLKSSVEQAKDIYDSALRKQKRYENILIQKVCDEMKIDVCDIFLSNNKCDLSPIGECAYYCDCEPTCIFCGEPEETK